jgi:beta-glucosidase-like glycosyl hydrolase
VPAACYAFILYFGLKYANVMLAGGVNLMRDPRNGRNFEYAGEDPLLAGVMVGNAIKGIESNHVISTLKHFALNDQETGRNELDARIDKAARACPTCWRWNWRSSSPMPVR